MFIKTMKYLAYILMFVALLNVANALTLINGTEYSPSESNVTYNITADYTFSGTVTVDNICVNITGFHPMCFTETTPTTYYFDLNTVSRYNLTFYDNITQSNQIYPTCTYAWETFDNSTGYEIIYPWFTSKLDCNLTSYNDLTDYQLNWTVLPNGENSSLYDGSGWSNTANFIDNDASTYANKDATSSQTTSIGYLFTNATVNSISYKGAWAINDVGAPSSYYVYLQTYDGSTWSTVSTIVSQVWSGGAPNTGAGFSGTYTLNDDALGVRLYYVCSIAGSGLCHADAYYLTIDGTDQLTEPEIVYMEPTKIIDVTFKDEDTKVLIDFETVTFEVISDTFSGNYSTNNGTLGIYFIEPESYTIRYSAPSYDENFYYFLLENRSTHVLTLYLVNSSRSTQVTATVYDEASNLLEDAHIKVLRYNILTNAYEQTQEVSTNFEGQAIMNLILNDEFYKFVIEYPSGTIKKTTEPAYVYATSLEFQIQLGSTVAETFFRNRGVSSNLTFNDATNNFRWTYLDSQNLVTDACLEIYSVSPLEETLYNSSCVSAVGGTILVGVDNSSTVTYLAKTYVYFEEDTPTFMESLYQSFFTTPELGNMGLFVTAILVMAFSFIGLVSPIAALLIAPLPIVFSAVLHLIEINVGTALAIYAVSIIIAFIVRK